MQSITYTARRSLIGGHSAGSQYSLNLPLADKDRENKVNRVVQTSLGGQTYTTFNHVKAYWHCKTRPITGTELATFREFLDSALDGQTMQFDPYQWAGASPTQNRAVVLDSQNYTERRQQAGSSETAHRFEISFVLREV